MKTFVTLKAARDLCTQYAGYPNDLVDLTTFARLMVYRDAMGVARGEVLHRSQRGPGAEQDVKALWEETRRLDKFFQELDGIVVFDMDALNVLIATVSELLEARDFEAAHGQDYNMLMAFITALADGTWEGSVTEAAKLIVAHHKPDVRWA